ncbi:MAG: cytochrome c biogenesis protein CcsA [Chromatiales bacterium]|uniref:cytochrome C assembly family protein n=1 Tax=endosymbiont of Lamellibrachia barhami TaxID=205975 RepID=UPI0034E23FF0
MLFELLAIAAYLGAGLCFALRLFRGETGKHLPRPLGLLLGFVGTALHGVLLYQSIATDTGINLGVFSATSLIAWTIVLLLLISSLSKPVENLGILLLPLAALSILLESRFSSVRLLGEAASQGLTLHVLVSILAYSLFTLASVQALLLAIQDHHLHHRRPGGFIRALPPLQTMESLLFEMISVGFVLLTLALISGFIFLEDMFAQHLAHKSILSIVAWIVFGTLIWGRFRFGWRGQKAIIWTLSGFVVLMLAYFGSKVVIELILTV